MNNNIIDLSNRSQIERVINGALKQTLDAHGRITIDNYSSASKRVYKALSNYAKSKRKKRK